MGGRRTAAAAGGCGRTVQIAEVQSALGLLAGGGREPCRCDPGEQRWGWPEGVDATVSRSAEQRAGACIVRGKPRAAAAAAREPECDHAVEQPRPAAASGGAGGEGGTCCACGGAGGGG